MLLNHSPIKEDRSLMGFTGQLQTFKDQLISVLLILSPHGAENGSITFWILQEADKIRQKMQKMIAKDLLENDVLKVKGKEVGSRKGSC